MKIKLLTQKLWRSVAAVVMVLGITAGYAPAAHAQTTPALLNPAPLRELYTKVNQGYLYSTNWSEVVSAQKNYGLTMPSQRPLGYVFTAGNTDTKPIYRLKQNSTGNWIMSVDQGEINWLTSHGFTMEGLTGYIYTTAQYGAQQLNRYTNGKGWRLAYQSQDSAMKSAGYTLDGPVGYMIPTYYQVGTYYFSAYDNNIPDTFLQAVKNYYGRYPDAWGGVRDFHGDPNSPWGNVPQNTQGWGGDWSYLKPTIGYYDDSQVSTLETQIDEAASAGLSYFSFYEYWNNQTNTPQLDKALNAFTQASNTNRLKFTLSLVLPGSNNGDPEHLTLPTSQFSAAADAYANYFTKSNYLTTQEGRPIVFMLETGGIGSGSPTDVNNFISLLKTDIKNKTGKDAYVMNESENGLNTVSQFTGDAYSCLNMGKYIVDGSYSEYVSDLPNYFKTFDNSGKPMMRCGMSGFNEAPRTGFWEAKSDVRYFKDDAKSQFPAAMTATINNMKAQPASPIDNYMTMYAWNEWHEGGIIEPNVRDGSYYLNNLQNTFGLPAH
ncbi:MAG TPA: glycoside hydrolase family 99-like domain-containing protein [Candidatus Saccharimonadales bacterium]|nr:glycoside hydrolase family 99-like domain-containing protein [Candidatus Saccharimonadales bacterium]